MEAAQVSSLILKPHYSVFKMFEQMRDPCWSGTSLDRPFEQKSGKLIKRDTYALRQCTQFRESREAVERQRYYYVGSADL